jgi:protocatechuate 3,4-dioxygenase beta subunit
VVKPDGLPGAGIIVEAAGASSQSSSAVFNAHGSTRTTADGTYQMSVPPDHSYMVGVFDQNWAAKTQTGLTARAGEPCDVPDLGLIKGTEIRGRVTLGPARKPLAGQTILLTESGPPVAVDNTGKARGQTNSIGRQLDADGKGRFSFRVGPGDYELTVIRDRDPHADFDRFPQKVGSETLIEREFQPEDRKDAGESRITGVVSDRKNGVLTPVAGARVEPVPYISSAGALIDSQGRFDLKWRPETWHHNSDKPLLYARSSDGALSAFTPISSDQREIAIELLEAGRATGEVVDENGKPLVGRGIHLDMSRSGSPLPFTGHPEDAVTDAHGRYTFSGLVVGAHCRVSSYEGEARRLDGAVFTRGFRVESAVPTTLPSLIFPDRPLPQASIGAKENEDGRLPVKFAPLARPATVPAGLSRAEIEALIQAIGRDPISPRLVDRIMERFHPRLWPNDFDDIRPVALDPAFVQRMDGLARDVLGKSLDTIMLLRCAIAYQPGFDDAIMKSLLKQWLANDRTPRSTVRGAVIDHETFLPIRNARVATDLHDFTDFGFVRTDEQGRFRLSVTPGSTWNVGYMELLNDLKHVPVYVEADGYASALRFVPVDEIEKAEDFEIALLPEAPLFGTVVDRSGRPIAGASVQAEATWATFITGGPKPRDFLDVLGGHFSVLTDREGRFSFAGVPAPDQQRSITLWVRHPEFRSTASSYVGAPTDPGAAPVVTLEPGCTVSGVVVNRAGNSVPEASVRVFDRETSFFQEQFARTDRDGRFRFRNMPPGWAMMLVESPRLAAAWAEIVATPARAIDNQFVLEPGRSVGGKVVDEAGKPVAGATVGCNVRFPAVNGIPSELSLNVSTLTADDGSFRTGSLPPGDLQLVATLESRGLTGETVLGSDRADVVIKLANGER